MVIPPPGDERELVDSIVHLYKNNLVKKEFLIKAKTYFQEEFTVEKMEHK